MKKIATIIDNFDKEINEVKKSKLEKLWRLKEKIKISKQCLLQLRLLIREEGFNSVKEEINFFKIQKPYVQGRLNFYMKLSDFLFEYPSVCTSRKRNYINKKLNKLDSNKCKNLEFEKYYRLDDNKFDKQYFLRGSSQLNIFINNSYHCEDPEFSSSHDHLVSQIITHDLLTKYYAKELDFLENKKYNSIIEEVKPVVFTDVFWESSKTDLTELIYALYSSGVIKTRETEIKELIEIFEELFNINLGNHHKTFSQVKDRQKDIAKFLDKLKYNLVKRIETDG